MRKVLLLVFFCAAVLSVSSCDFLRSLAGRPTSEQLKAVTAAAAPTPSVSVEPALQSAEEYEMEKRYGRLNVPLAYTHTDSELKAVPEHRYYIVVGTYRQRPTMNRMVSDVRKAGFEPSLLEYANGLTSVGLLPCDDLGQAIDAYARVKKEKFCPGDACILIAK